jgi:hypothetical protein
MSNKQYSATKSNIKKNEVQETQRTKTKTEKKMIFEKEGEKL